jgi:hypothetical protein
MKSKSLLLASMVLLIPSLAFAKPKDSVNVDLDQPVTVAGTQLAAGHYKATWGGNGPNITVRFAQGKKVVATAPAKLLNQPNDQQGIVTDATADDTNVLQSIDLNKITIQFENAGQGAGN